MTRNSPASAFDQRHVEGPFDVIGDVHGCAGELLELLARLGWHIEVGGTGLARAARVVTPGPNRLVFVGDLVDRGPRAPDVLRIVMQLHADGRALAVPGNHDDKFMRWLDGNPVKLAHGLQDTVAQMGAEPKEFHARVRHFLAALPPYLWLDGGRLVVAHAGIEEAMVGRASDRIRRFCLYGDTDGRTAEYGLAIRYNWAARYHGRALIVYGHTPVAEPTAVHETICIDTGCCFGGALTALRYPERACVSVAAHHTYATRARPFGLPPERS